MQFFLGKKFQRFHFGPSFGTTYVYKSKDQDGRRLDDINSYHRFKNDKTVVTQDGCVYYYIVCSRWMENWKKFANGEKSQPGPVENKSLAKKIMNMRQDQNYRLNDNSLPLKEPQDFYYLSKDFWCMFRDRYGCDKTIMLKKYDSPDKMMPEGFKKGKLFSICFPEEDTWFDQNVDSLEGKNEYENSQIQTKFVAREQEGKYNKTHVICIEWVRAWQDYHNNINSPNRIPPGPIRNEKLAQELLGLKVSIDSGDRFYYVNKRIFYFFHTIYGGGPAIIENSYFDNQANQQPIVRTVSSRNDDQSSNSS